MAPSPITVAVIDPSGAMRAGTCAQLRSDERFAAVAEGAGPGELRADAPPGLLIIDPTAGGRLEAELVREAVRRFPGSGVLLFTDCSESEFYAEAFRLGVRGLVSKSRASTNELLEAAWLVGTGRALVADRTAVEGMLEERRSRPRRPLLEPVVDLSPREQEVLRLLGEGLGDGQIAHRLQIRASTVQTHIHNILARTGVSSRFQLGAYALATGLVDWPPSGERASPA